MTEGEHLVSLLVATLPLVGTGLGFLMTWRREKDKARKAQIGEVYSNLLLALAESSGARRMRIASAQLNNQRISDADREWSENQDSVFAKANADFVLYGSPAVVHALSEYYDGAMLPPGDPRKTVAFVTLFETMRLDLVAQDYRQFGSDADNILGSGAMARHQAMNQAMTMAQPMPTVAGGPIAATRPV